MKKCGKLIFTIILLLLLPFLLWHSTVVGEGVRWGLTLSFRAVIPALFPAMVLCGMIGELAEAVPAPVPLTVWLTSHLCGFPLGERTLAKVYHRGLLSKKQAIRLSACCSNASPAFLIAYAGEMVLHSRKMGILLFISQLLVSLFLCMLLNAFQGSRRPDPEERPLLPVLTDSIAAAATGSLVLSGYITLFSVVGALFQQHSGYAYFYGFLELSGGLCVLPRGVWQLYFAAAMTAFSGWSVMLQNSAFLLAEQLPLWPMLLGKLFYLICLPPVFLFLASPSPTAAWILFPLLGVALIFMISFDKRQKSRYNEKK